MNPPLDSVTITATGDPETGDTTSRAFLFLVFQAYRPLDPPARIALPGAGEVIVGRGSAEQRRSFREEEGRLLVAVHDERMSRTHARFRSGGGAWSVEHVGGKNRMRVNGVERSRAQLRDGDIVEIGRTFFLFRASVQVPPDIPTFLDAAELRAPAPVFATLHPELEEHVAEFATIARSSAAVLIEGETGTGKELVASALHEASGRKGDFVAFNCGALTETLLEAELFGSNKGAFTGANEARKGHVRSADKGTLFMDEIGELSPKGQVALLRVLEKKEVVSVGASHPVKVDVRFVAATHRSLDELVAAERFREDLLHRIASAHRIRMPPLAARREDLGLLIGVLLRELCGEEPPPRLGRLAALALLRYPWPGNVRELKQCLESAVPRALDSSERKIKLRHLPATVRTAASSKKAAQRAQLVKLLQQYGGNLTAVAKHLGTRRQQVQRMLKYHGISVASFRRGLP